MRYALLAISLMLLSLALPLSHASYIITGINDTVSLNTNSSASVVEIYKISLSNQSVGQYAAYRLALNFTLSEWQTIIGPDLTVHIINPRGSVYRFAFDPGPVQISNNGKIAYMIVSYIASNVTDVNQTGPRTFTYNFNPSVLNFQNAESGEILGLNTTLTVITPSNSRITAVSPPPDYPPLGFTKNYTGVTTLTWSSDELLAGFTLKYTTQESLQDEVIQFFTQVYTYLGIGIYFIIIGIIAIFILYTYFKAR